MKVRLLVLVTAAGLALTACGGPKQVSGQSPITEQSGAASQPSGVDDPGPGETTAAGPFVAPSGYQDKSWSYRPDPQSEGVGAGLKVPQGWAETKREAYWSDFLDPTGQVRLRVDVTAGIVGDERPVAPSAAATAELDRLKSAAGFKLISQRTVPVEGDAAFGAAEIVYQFSRGDQTVQCTYRFVGDDAITQARIGIYYPPAEQDKAEQVLVEAQNTLRFAG